MWKACLGRLGLQCDQSDLEYEILIAGNRDRSRAVYRGIYDVQEGECKQLEVFKSK